MSRGGDTSARVCIVGCAGELRSTVEGALADAPEITVVPADANGDDGSMGETGDGSEETASTDGVERGDGEPMNRGAAAGGGLARTSGSSGDGVPTAVRTGLVDCVVCGPDRETYDAVRRADDRIPVVVVGSDVEEAFLTALLADLATEYVAGERLATVLPAQVRRSVDRQCRTFDWQLADVTDEALVAFALDTYAVREANDVFFEQWGWDRDDLAGATLSDLRETDITHEHRSQERDSGGADLEWITDDDDPVGTFVEGTLRGDFEVREWHCRTADGRAFKSEVRIVADRTDERGLLVATVPEGSDERTPVDDHDEASMLQSVMEHVPMSVYFEDRLGRHVLVSEDLVEPFVEGTDGKVMHTPADVHGKTYFDLYTEEMAVRATGDNEEIMETGEPLRGQEKHVQPPGGDDLWFSTHKAPWYDDGWVRGIVGITVDITEQKRRERELDRQNERLQEFASIVSHDLRNPLNVAQARLDLFRRTGEEDELDTVAEMHDRMASIIDDALTYASEGSRVEDATWLDPTVPARRAWACVDTADATLDLASDYAIEADPDRLVRVFENLFGNAVEHGSTSHANADASADAVEHGTVTDDAADLTVRLGTLDDEAGFYVEDDGVGVPEAERHEVFERGTSTDPDGTGFGLAIVREIADAHGWEVRLTESDAGGARFEFTGVKRRDRL